MLEWVEVVDPRWVQDLTEINKTQNYVHFTQQWWIQKGDKLGKGSYGKVRWVQRKQGSPAKPCAAKIIEKSQAFRSPISGDGNADVGNRVACFQNCIWPSKHSAAS